MKAALKFTYYDPIADRFEFLTNGVEVQICSSINADLSFEVLARSRSCDESGLFYFKNIELAKEANIFFRVGFLKRNLDLRDSLLYGPEDSHAIPTAFARYPVPLITWSSFDRKGLHGEDGFFHGIRKQSLGTPDAPLAYPVLFRQIYIFGHRGAPYYFPENSIDSISKAFEFGANAIELDICFTKDDKIIVLHDPDPFITPTRNLLERLPYPLISPEIEFENGEYRWRYLENAPENRFSNWQKLNSRDQLDISRLELPVVKKIYHYRHPVKKTVSPQLLSDVFAFYNYRKNSRLVFFLDTKIEPKAAENDPGYLTAYAGEMHRILSGLQAQLWNWHFIIGCPVKRVISEIAKVFREKGMLSNCDFVIDAQGGFGMEAMLGLDKAFGARESPLQENLDAGFRIVSIGKLARPGSRDEIREAVRYKEANPAGQIQWIIYWTIDSPNEIYELLQEGVDGILTNRPEIALSVLKRLKVQISS